MSFDQVVNHGNIKEFYKFGKTLGTGGFAKVKKAVKLDDSEEEYAVKIIKMTSMNVDDYLAIGNEVEI